MVADEIKKLSDLYKAGALSKEEYEAQKKKLLDRQ
ncbi:MAG: SHOCT domain-containing protein [Ferruginibacter sp.]